MLRKFNPNSIFAILALAGFVLSTSVANASAPPLIFETGAGEVKFTATGKPGFLKIRGESKGAAPAGTIRIENGTAIGDLKFDLKSLTTGIDLRDEHMKDKYLEVAKFPQAVLKLKPLPIGANELESDFKKSFSGTLSLHGVEKDVNGEFSYSAKTRAVTASFELKVSDFKIDVPQYLGVTVSETVAVETNLTLKK